MKNAPTVTVGMNVYNGENHIREALDSILAQTFSDFELIISDNASTDATGEICRDYALRDQRIQYICHERNRGAAWNANHVMRLARGQFFRHTSHDDIIKPAMLEKCLHALSEHPEAVLAFPVTGIMTGGDRRSRQLYRDDLDTANPRPDVRFGQLIRDHAWSAGFRIFGVVRRDALLSTPLFGDHYAADDVITARLALRGPMVRVEEELFMYRVHSEQSIQHWQDPEAYSRWWNTDNEGRVYPNWRLMRELYTSVRDAPISASDKARCHRHVLSWIWRRRAPLFRELFGIYRIDP